MFTIKNFIMFVMFLIIVTGPEPVKRVEVKKHQLDEIHRMCESRNGVKHAILSPEYSGPDPVIYKTRIIEVACNI